MPKKTCPNGHIYDSSIYGDECPLCPKDDATQYSPKQDFGMPPFEKVSPEVSPRTSVLPPKGAQGPTHNPFEQHPVPGGDPTGDTVFGQQAASQMGGRTVIRPPKGAQAVQGRKLVGFLVTYNRTPMGKAYNVYEGKNYIGRDRSCDICIPEDKQMSGRHMSLLYRNADNKFKYRDEQSSNGTFVNKELSDEGELKNYDVIRLGSTVFIFIAIPQIG